MTDTSGRSGFGVAGRKIRTDIKRRFGGGGGGGRKKPRPSPPTTTFTFRFTEKGGVHTVTPIPVSKPEVEPSGVPAMIPIVTKSFWTHLGEAGRLETVLLPSELLYYLKEMARFIETANKAGLQGVAKAFEIRETSTFFILRRRISSRAPGSSDSDAEGSEHHTRAATAFNRGAIRLAEELTGIDDPTQVMVSRLVQEIQNDDTFQRALVLSARLILQEYGELVISRPFRSGETWAEPAKYEMVAGFRAQLNDFFTKHNEAKYWREAAIEKTLRSFPLFVLRERTTTLIR
jgi:hypothetical protein